MGKIVNTCTWLASLASASKQYQIWWASYQLIASRCPYKVITWYKQSNMYLSLVHTCLISLCNLALAGYFTGPKQGDFEKSYILGNKYCHQGIYCSVAVYHSSTEPMELEQDNQSDTFYWISLFISCLYCTNMGPLGRKSGTDWYRGIWGRTVKSRNNNREKDENVSEGMKEQ